jgi:peroxidase
LPEIVKKVVTAEFELDPTSAGPQLRLFFHDCFVQGCDASVLLNSTKVNQAEKDASINFSLSNFFVIDEVKEQLEKECPGVVSCADVVALVAVYSIQAVRHCCSAAAACILKSLLVLRDQLRLFLSQ